MPCHREREVSAFLLLWSVLLRRSAQGTHHSQTEQLRPRDRNRGYCAAFGMHHTRRLEIVPSFRAPSVVKISEEEVVDTIVLLRFDLATKVRSLALDCQARVQLAARAARTPVPSHFPLQPQTDSVRRLCKVKGRSTTARGLEECLQDRKRLSRP